jgi:hypothetical protein
MYIEAVSPPMRRITDLYTVTIFLSHDGPEYDVQGRHSRFMIRPDKVIMIWRRWQYDDLSSGWERVVMGGFDSFSRIEGQQVLKSGAASRSSSRRGSVIVTLESELHGELREYAASLPGLKEKIAELEHALPA